MFSYIALEDRIPASHPLRAVRQLEDLVLAEMSPEFDRLYAEGATNPRVMALAVHPYISGAPHRIGYVEAAYDYIRQHDGIWMTTGEEICAWYRSNP